MLIKCFFIIALLVLIPSTTALAHFDFIPRIESNQIITAGHDDENGIDVASLRVGGYDFGENIDDPYNIGDPGFNTVGASTFTGGTQLRLRGLAIDGKNLRYWNGIGSPSFSPAPAGVTLDLSASPTRAATFSDASVTYTPASTPSLLIGSFAANGAMHVHLTSSIFADGDQLADSVPQGAYLLSFELFNQTSDGNPTGVVPSTPLFIVYNNGLTEAQHAAAINFAQSTYVPEPASLLWLISLGALLIRAPRAVRQIV